MGKFLKCAKQVKQERNQGKKVSFLLGKQSLLDWMWTRLVPGEDAMFSPICASQQPMKVSVFHGHLFLPVLVNNWRLNFSRPGHGSLDRKLHAAQRHLFC